jgi:rhodanese-related sulfurtransferase
MVFQFPTKSSPNPIIAMQATHQAISPTELKSLLATGCCLVDVREPVEHAEEHITGAKLIPLGQLEKRVAEIDKNSPLVVMCRSGKRGGDALKTLEAKGITNARNLEGGILAWKAAGLPVDASAKKVLPLMQQVHLTIGVGVLTGAILALTVHPNWVFLCAFFGAGLVMAGSTGWCGLALLMSKMPWNRVAGQSCGASASCSTTR